MEWTYSGKILLMMTFMIQSSIGLAISLAHLLAYSRLNPGQNAKGLFEFFYLMGFTLHATMRFMCLVWLIVEAAITLAHEWGRRRIDRRRREEQATYENFALNTDNSNNSAMFRFFMIDNS